MKRKILSSISFILNLVLLVYEVIYIAACFVIGGDGNMANAGFGAFRYFTIDSNTLVAVSAAVLLPFELICVFSRKERTVPTAVSVLKLAGTTGAALTFLVVIAFLGPTQGYAAMFEGGNYYLHGVCPVLAMISFIFFDGGGPISRKQSLPALLPLVIYAVVYTTMVVFIGGWEDFYGLNPGGFWPVSMIILLALNALVVMLLRKLHNRFAA